MRHLLASSLLAILSSSVHGSIYEVTISVTNMAPVNGLVMAPVWVGAHDGTFDVFSVGQAAPQYLESLAEDGMTGPLGDAFLASQGHSTYGTIFGNGLPGFEQFQDIIPGETQSITLTLDSSNPDHQYFSFAHMVVPSNDAFSASEDPLAHPFFDGVGNFIAQGFTTDGNTQVWDAGTEVNDEIPANTALLAQMAPNTGQTQGGVVELHPGFQGSALLGGPIGNILSAPYAVNADFTAPGGYPLAAFQFEAVLIPAPGALALGLAAAFARTRRRR